MSLKPSRTLVLSALGLAALALAALWAAQSLGPGPDSPESPNSPQSNDTGDATSTAGGVLATDDLARLAVDEMINFIPSASRKPVSTRVFEDGDAAETTLAEFRGRVVLLNFWATWCAPCRRELPSLDRLEGDLGGEDFAVVAISIDRTGRDKVQAFMTEVGVKNLELYLDRANRVGRSMGAVGLPTSILVDRQGHSVGRLVGPAEWDSGAALTLIKAVMGEGA